MPCGYNATTIYDEPHDEQIEYKLDEEFDLFLKDIKRNLGFNEKIKQ